ncbi:UNKNOWN [Stylonychia lemnae]|uniref:Uncharacterized protein n=1 Tax=Stylonychia lemnae TaxID=5949 RepID=A0A078A5H0_STYLE|nr:UNKNOWN [Stylonychia lemnae]|eukprot:CDW77139.1 UNKNOWN [Stylonychia lemnae]
MTLANINSSQNLPSQPIKYAPLIFLVQSYLKYNGNRQICKFPYFKMLQYITDPLRFQLGVLIILSGDRLFLQLDLQTFYFNCQFMKNQSAFFELPNQKYCKSRSGIGFFDAYQVISYFSSNELVSITNSTQSSIISEEYRSKFNDSNSTYQHQ